MYKYNLKDYENKYYFECPEMFNETYFSWQGMECFKRISMFWKEEPIFFLKEYFKNIRYKDFSITYKEDQISISYIEKIYIDNEELIKENTNKISNNPEMLKMFLSIIQENFDARANIDEIESYIYKHYRNKTQKKEIEVKRNISIRTIEQYKNKLLPLYEEIKETFK